LAGFASLQAIGTAVPSHDVDPPVLGWARRQLARPRNSALFERMAGRSAITRRWRFDAYMFGSALESAKTSMLSSSARW